MSVLVMVNVRVDPTKPGGSRRLSCVSHRNRAHYLALDDVHFRLKLLTSALSSVLGRIGGGASKKPRTRLEPAPRFFLRLSFGALHIIHPLARRTLALKTPFEASFLCGYVHVLQIKLFISIAL